MPKYCISDVFCDILYTWLEQTQKKTLSIIGSIVRLPSTRNGITLGLKNGVEKTLKDLRLFIKDILKKIRTRSERGIIGSRGSTLKDLGLSLLKNSGVSVFAVKNLIQTFSPSTMLIVMAYPIVNFLGVVESCIETWLERVVQKGTKYKYFALTVIWGDNFMEVNKKYVHTK